MFHSLISITFYTYLAVCRAVCLVSFTSRQRDLACGSRWSYFYIFLAGFFLWKLEAFTIFRASSPFSLTLVLHIERDYDSQGTSLQKNSLLKVGKVVLNMKISWREAFFGYVFLYVEMGVQLFLPCGEKHHENVFSTKNKSNPLGKYFFMLNEISLTILFYESSFDFCVEERNMLIDVSFSQYQICQ